MKHFNSKKGLLTLAALATCLFASAETTVVAENVSPDGKTFTYEADIDFEKQSLEVVVDLTNSGYYSLQDILSVGENATVMSSGYSNSNALHLLYTPNSKQIECCYYAGDRYYNTKTDVAKSEHTIKLSKDGLFFDGALWEGTTTYSTATAADATTLAQLLALNHIFIGSTFASSYGSYSYATYKSIKVVDNETETPEPPVTITPDTLQIPLTETYTPLATHNNEFIGITDIDFDKQTLSVTVDATNIGGVEGLLSIGEDIASLNGNEAGNIHVYASPLNSYGETYVTMGIMYYNNTQTKYVKRAILSIPVADAKITFELSKENGLTTKVGEAAADVKIDAATLASLLGVKTIQVGSILSGVGGISSAVNNTTCPIDSILVKEIPPVAKPESIPFDLTEKGGWIAEGETFAWDADIDWDSQALEIVMDLSTCNASSSNDENILSIAGTQDDLKNWGGIDEPGHIHFYYTKSYMEVNYLTSAGNRYRNKNYSLFTGAANDTIVISRDGVKVNSTLWAGASEYGSYTSFDATTIAPLLALSHIWVGDTQGNPSYATYKSIKLVDYLPEVVTLRDDAEDYVAPEVTSPVTVNLKKQLNVNEWNSFCVPFDITAEQAKAQFGEDVKIAKWKKSVTEAGLPEFETVTSIEAGLPYLVYPTTAATELNDSITGYQFTKVASFVEEPDETFEATITTTDGEEESVSNLMFVGCFTPAFYTSGEGLACWNISGTSFSAYQAPVATQEPVETAGFHAAFVTDNMEADLSNWTLDGTPVNKTNAISGVSNTQNAESMRVYSINGQLLKANAKDLNTLPLGVYIVNGKKYIRK